MTAKKISSLASKMSRSDIPPFVQEHILENIDRLREKELDTVIEILDTVNGRLLTSAQRNEKMIRLAAVLSEALELRVISETEIIEVGSSESKGEVEN